MKKLITFWSSSRPVLLGCNISKPIEKTAGKVDDTTANSTAQTAHRPQRPHRMTPRRKRYVGSYVGGFGDNKITLLVTKVSGNAVSGRSIVGGNDRPFDGTYTFENAAYTVVANEPGDHKDDGVFKFSIDATTRAKLQGTWKANDPKRPEKSFTLERRQV